MADINFVGSVTVAANTTVELFTATSVTAAAGNWTFFSMPEAGGLVQVDTSGSATGQVQYPLSEGTVHVDAASFYVANVTASSITFDARFTSSV